MTTCQALTRNGAPCSANANGNGYCAFHDPARAEVIARGRRAGGQRGHAGHGSAPVPDGVTSLADVRRVLAYALAECGALPNSVPRVRALVAIAAAYTEAIKTGELEERLLRIEQVLAQRKASL